MYDLNAFYINGIWRNAGDGADRLDIINPATTEVLGSVALGNSQGVDEAVKAARVAFRIFGKSSRRERIDWLEKIIECYQARYEEFVKAITLEMGAPVTLSRTSQAYTGIEHFEAAIKALKEFEDVQAYSGYCLNYEPIGVCGLIAPWNWPINQIACKVAPALAAGCTMVLKPSEYSTLSAQLFAEVIHEAGLPQGVFNMVYGDGPNVGAALSHHPDIDMISFTGSTIAGIAVAQAAAVSVKRVSQELGGKSPVILTDGVDLETVVPDCVWLCMENSGQSCNAGTRLLVPANLHDQVVEIAKKTVEAYKVGNPQDENTQIGPLANRAQFEKVRAILEQAELSGLIPVTGGSGPVKGCETGYFIQPSVFAGLRNDQPIANEEIFGPVLAILPYETLEEAIQIANDTPYGLSAYLYTSDNDLGLQLAREIRVGMVHINGAPLSPDAPFGGYKQSGNGREWGVHGLHEFIEIKAIMSTLPNSADGE